MKLALEIVPPQINLGFNQVRRELKIISKDHKNPSTIYFIQEKEPKEFESLEVGFVAIDEADECPYDTFKTLRSRLRKTGQPLYGLLAFNPPNTLHWIHDFFVKEADSTKQLFSNNTYENIHNLSIDYVSELQKTYSGDELKRYLYGEWGSVYTELAVFNNWRSSVHMMKCDYVPGIPVIVGIDYGMMAGALACQLVNGQLRVLAELSEFNSGADMFSPRIVERFGQMFGSGKFVYLSDPTFISNRSSVDARTIKQVSKEVAGIDLKDGIADWMERMNSVNFFLTKMSQGEASLLVDPSCKTLIAGFEGGYKFREKSTRRLASDVEDSEYTALHDCLQHVAWYCKRQSRSVNFNYAPLQQEAYDFGNL